MEILEKLVIPLAFVLGMSGNLKGQEIPTNYAKADTVVKNGNTTITLYDSLDAPLYKEIKRNGNVSNTYYTYDEDHNKTKQISKNFDSAGNRTFTSYSFFEYDKKGNIILKKQESYGKNFAPNVFAINKYKYKKKKLNRENIDRKYFSIKEEEKVKTILIYLEDETFQRIGKIKSYKKGKLISKKIVIDLYNKKGKFLKEITP